jgi:hypothetical protein
MDKNNWEDVFRQGYLEGVKAHAVWRNGEQLVGTMQHRWPDYADRLVAGKDSYFNEILGIYKQEEE